MFLILKRPGGKTNILNPVHIVSADYHHDEPKPAGFCIRLTVGSPIIVNADEPENIAILTKYFFRSH